MTVLVKLSVAGTSTTLFNLYSNIDYNTAIVTGITKLQLQQQGYLLSNVPNNATIIRVVATDNCSNSIDIPISLLTTTSSTTSSTSSSTSTSTSTTTVPITSSSTTSTSTSTTSTTTILDCTLAGNAVSI